jgi:predicted NBD/HSP70 family sugar kinase
VAIGDGDNRSRLLRALMRDRASSRAELCLGLNLSRATVTSLLVEFEQAGIIEQQADDHPRRVGRPPLQISLASTAAYAIGLHLGDRSVRAALCDLGGHTVEAVSAKLVEDGPTARLDLAERLAGELLSTAERDGAPIIGVGVATPAPSALVADELEARLDLPVTVENDAHAGALGEHLLGTGRGVAQMAYVGLTDGVGLGLVLDGKLYRGAGGIAGGLGHFAAVKDGLICRCGNRGCLVTAASPAAIAGLLGRSRHTTVSVDELLALIAAGDRGTRRAVADAGTLIGGAIGATVNLLNLELVVIGGELAMAGDVLLDPIRSAVAEQTSAPAASAVRIVQSEAPLQAEASGAAAIQLVRAPEVLARRVNHAA